MKQQKSSPGSAIPIDHATMVEPGMIGMATSNGRPYHLSQLGELPKQVRESFAAAGIHPFIQDGLPVYFIDDDGRYIGSLVPNTDVNQLPAVLSTDLRPGKNCIYTKGGSH